MKRRDSKELLQGISMALYERISLDKNEPSMVRIQARRRYDELLGLDEPKKHEVSEEVRKVVKFSVERGEKKPEVGPDEPNPNRYPGL